MLWMRWACCLVLAALLLAAAPAARAQDGRWLRAETQHFVLYSDGRESDLRATARTLEQFGGMLRRLVPPSNESHVKLDVYLLRNQASLRTVAPRLPATRRGFYTARPEMVAAFAVFRNVGGVDAQEILFHEYAHHYMLHYFAQAYPAWFTEGFAELVQTAEIADDHAIIGRYSDGRAAWLVAADWISTTQLLVPPRSMSSEQRALFYAQAGSQCTI